MNDSRIEIRKYPNRRYYNTRESRHVTLEEIRDLVREGHEIRVVDSRTEDDITVAVLTQILLEIESPKLAFFPSALLQHLIRLNSDMFKTMMEGYLRGAMASFAKAAESADGGAKAGFGLPLAGSFEEWQKMWTGMFPHSAGFGSTTAFGAKPERSDPGDTADQIAALNKQMEEMKRALEELQSRRKK